MGIKTLRWLLAISLAANVFFVVVSVRHRPFLHPQMPDPHHIVDFLSKNLSPADAAILRQSFQDHAAAQPGGMDGPETFMQSLRAALTANPFDAAALKAAFAEGQARQMAMQDSLAAAFVEAASKMSPDGRASLAALRGLRGFGPPHGPHPAPPPPQPPSY